MSSKEISNKIDNKIKNLFPKTTIIKLNKAKKNFKNKYSFQSSGKKKKKKKRKLLLPLHTSILAFTNLSLDRVFNSNICKQYRENLNSNLVNTNAENKNNRILLKNSVKKNVYCRENNSKSLNNIHSNLITKNSRSESRQFKSDATATVLDIKMSANLKKSFLKNRSNSIEVYKRSISKNANNSNNSEDKNKLAKNSVEKSSTVENKKPLASRINRTTSNVIKKQSKKSIYGFFHECDTRF